MDPIKIAEILIDGLPELLTRGVQSSAEHPAESNLNKCLRKYII